MTPQTSAAPAIVERSARRWLLLAFLTLGMFFCYFQRNALSAATPFMMKDLGLNKAAMGVLLSAFFWSYALSAVPFGWLLDRYGIGKVYAVGFAIWMTAVAATGLCNSFAMLIVARVLLGCGQGVVFPASARAVASWFPAGERGGVTGVYISGNRLGQAATLAVGPAIIAAWGWRIFFLIAGGAGVIWLIGWLPTMHLWDADREPASRNEPAARPSMRDALPLLRDRRMAGIFWGFFAYDYIWFLYVTWMPGYLALERKFSPSEMATFSSVPFLIVTVVLILAGILGDSLVRAGGNEITVRKCMITAGLLVSLLLVPSAFVHSNTVCVWLMTISICGLGISAPNCWALTQAVCPRPLVATASGFQNFGGNLGGVVAPALTGLIAHVTGSFQLAFVIAGAIVVAGIACYWVLIPRSEGAGRPHATL